MRVTIAIPTYNRSRWLAETLASLAAHRHSFPEADVEVLVVDNNSSDDTAAVAARAIEGRPNWRYLHEPVQGANQSRNRAVREGWGDIIVLLDDDVLLQPGWLDALVAPWFGPGAEKIAAVGGEVVPVFPEGLPGWLQGWATPLRLRPDAGPLPPRQMPMSANLAFHRTAFDRFGLFRTDLGRKGKNVFSGDESELMKRFHRGGWEVWFAPGAAVHHQFPATRMNLHYTCRHSFDSARSRVVERATEGEDTRLGRVTYCVSRCLANLAKGLFLGLAIVLLFCLGKSGTAKKRTIQLARSAGYVVQTLRSLPGALFAPPAASESL